MRKFIRNFLCFVLITLLVCLALTVLDIFVVRNQYDESYTAAINDKLNRLQVLESPKVIILGDSNLAFGINSEKIETALEMPVVNMGLHGGIADVYYEELVKPHIREGDLVIIAPYVFEQDSIFPDKGLAMTMLEKNPLLWEPVSARTRWELVPAYPYYAYSCLTKWITLSGNKAVDSSYSRDAFNEYGDVVNKPAQYGKTAEALFANEGVIVIPPYNQQSFDRINAFYDYIVSKGARLLLAAYPVADCQDRPDVTEYENFEAVLRNNLDCPMISRFEDYFIKPEYFYDTILHLTPEGADLRTEQLIRDLKNYLSQEQ